MDAVELSAKNLKKLVRRHGALVSGVTAGCVAAFLLCQEILTRIVSWLGLLPYLANDDPYSQSPLGLSVAEAFVIALPFGVGFFLSLWLVAPIAEELRVGHVITRSVLATGIASTVLFVILAIVGLVGAFSPSGASLAGHAFPWPSFSGDTAVVALGRALQDGLRTFVETLPLGVLAGVLLWLWRKDHPPRHPLAGFIDEI